MASQGAVTILTHPASQENMTHRHCNHLKERVIRQRGIQEHDTASCLSTQSTKRFEEHIMSSPLNTDVDVVHRLSR